MGHARIYPYRRLSHCWTNDVGVGEARHARTINNGTAVSECPRQSPRPAACGACGADHCERLAQGHDTSLQDVPGWDIPTLAGAGALRSTAYDMMRFPDACQGRQKSSLTPAIASLLKVRRQTDNKEVYAAAGWFVETAHNDELVAKDGGTGGYAAFIGYSARTGIAAVLLSNRRAGPPPRRSSAIFSMPIFGCRHCTGRCRSEETDRVCRSLSADTSVRIDGSPEGRAFVGPGNGARRVRGLSGKRHPLLLSCGEYTDHLRAGTRRNRHSAGIAPEWQGSAGVRSP